jgi:carbonic anhydrase
VKPASRARAELIFDLGLGDIFNARIAGNIARFETEAVKATTAPEDAE